MKIKDNKLNWSLNVAARLFVGAVFIFSSFTKGVDPLGTSYKITEYLTTWQFGSLTFEWLVPMATVMAMTLIVLEFTVGMMLLFGAFRRLSGICRSVSGRCRVIPGSSSVQTRLPSGKHPSRR